MRKRIAALLISLSLLMAFCLSAAQAVTYPEKHGAVNDDAAVLSASTANDVDSLNSRSDVDFTVVTRHFLGGMDAQEYCDGLFKAWKLGENDVLLLLVIGEERYACTLGSDVSGKYISSEQLNSLLSSNLRPYFIQNRDYDGAVGHFLLAAASQAARAAGKTLNTNGLFGSSQTQGASSQSSSSSSGSSFTSWTEGVWNSFFSDNELNNANSYNYNYEYEYENESGFSMGKLILILIILLIIVKHRKKNGKSGLGPFGWMTVGAGAKQVMRDTNRSNHRHSPPPRNSRPPRR